MSKAIIMKTTGIVSVNGKNAKPGKFLVDGDVVKTGPESFAGFMFVETKTMQKILQNTVWTNLSDEEMNAEVDEEYGEGYISGVVAQGNRADKEAAMGGFVVQHSTGVAGVKG